MSVQDNTEEVCADHDAGGLQQFCKFLVVIHTFIVHCFCSFQVALSSRLDDGV